MSKYLDYYNKLKETRPCINGVPLASGYEAFIAQKYGDGRDYGDDEYQGGEEEYDIESTRELEVIGMIDIYVDGKLVYGPVYDGSVITVTPHV